jgi:hypothetical protein
MMMLGASLHGAWQPLKHCLVAFDVTFSAALSQRQSERPPS